MLTEGIGFIAEMEWEMKSNLQRLYDVNVIGVLKTVRAFLPLLRKNKGRIVTIGGFAGMIRYTGNVLAYSFIRVGVRQCTTLHAALGHGGYIARKVLAAR